MSRLAGLPYPYYYLVRRSFPRRWSCKRFVLERNAIINYHCRRITFVQLLERSCCVHYTIVIQLYFLSHRPTARIIFYSFVGRTVCVVGTFVFFCIFCRFRYVIQLLRYPRPPRSSSFGKPNFVSRSTHIYSLLPCVVDGGVVVFTSR